MAPAFVDLRHIEPITSGPAAPLIIPPTPIQSSTARNSGGFQANHKATKTVNIVATLDMLRAIFSISAVDLLGCILWENVFKYKLWKQTVHPLLK